LKILLGSHFFLPSRGGIETATDLLAREFVTLGHDVRVITQSEGAGIFPFEVIRRPGVAELLREVKWCEAFLQNNISLQTLWPLLLIRRPLFVTHQTWIAPGWTRPLKLAVLRLATNLSISRAIAKALPCSSIQVGNPYDDHVFRELEGKPRARDLIFVGRLVSDKGADLFLKALAILRQSGVAASTTMAGDGPERRSLEQKAEELGLRESVAFVGNKEPAELADLLNQHRILVVPSLWPEPFGIVALEGVACGCVVLGSADGGLPEAIGPCGLTFPNGDAPALASLLQKLLTDPARVAELRRGREKHLAPFTRRHVATLYLQTMGALS
jgi:glycosyltransferase involved in cell wall biosynthesis